MTDQALSAPEPAEPSWLASRRSFMVGAGALLFAAPKLALSKLPILYGDGQHDDTEALNAFFAGRPVKTLAGDTFRSLFEDGVAALKGGTYRVSDTVRCAARGVFLADATFIGDGLPHDRSIFELALPATGAAMTSCIRRCRIFSHPPADAALRGPSWAYSDAYISARAGRHG